MTRAFSPILPGSTIGILGGGQLGRMTALAARQMGYRIHVLDPDADCSAAPVADRVIAAKFSDADAAADLASHCDVVTLEIEQIGVDALDRVRERAPLRPGRDVIAVIQDRARQKRWLRDGGFPVGEYHDVASASELASAFDALGPLFVKANHGGYDGRSQARVGERAEVDEVWQSLAGRPSVAERGLDLDYEISVMVARRPSGEIRCYDPCLNHHERQILAWSSIPAPIPERIARDATDVARGIAESFSLEGILGVEMFVTTDGKLLVNELAPRPHNSYHQTEAGCATSQFEQIVRAVCDLPLGDTRVLRPAAIVNLFGDLWVDGRAPAFDAALSLPEVRVHLYGKRGPRPGRKMGHISATGDTPQAALELARRAFALLQP